MSSPIDPLSRVQNGAEPTALSKEKKDKEKPPIGAAAAIGREALLEGSVTLIGTEDNALVEQLIHLPELLRDEHALETIIDSWGDTDKMAEVFNMVCGQLIRPQIAFAKDYGSNIFQSGSDYVKMPEDIQTIGKSIIQKLTITDIGVRSVEGLVLGTLIIYKALALNGAKDWLEMIKKGEKSASKEQIEKFEKFLEKEGVDLKDQSIDLGVKTLGFLPRGLHTVLNTLSHIPHTTLLLQAISYANVVSWVLTSGYSFYQAVDTYSTVRDWKAKLNDKPLKREDLNKLFEARLAAREQAKQKERQNFEQMLADIQQEGRNPIVALKSAGISLLKAKQFSDYVLSLENGEAKLESPDVLASKYKLFQRFSTEKQIKEDKEESPFSPQELKTLLNEEAFKHSVFEQYCESKQAKIIGTRNALKAMTLQKQATEQSSLKFDVKTTGLAFALTSLAALATIAMKIAVVAGIIVLPAGIAAIPGAGLALLAIAMLAIGLYYLIRYKPHLFQSLIRGTSIKLLANEIPLSVYNYKLHKAEKQREEKIHFVRILTEKKNQLRQSILRHEGDENRDLVRKLKKARFHLEKVCGKYAKQKEILDGKIKEIQDNMAGWKNRVENYKRELNEARTKDLFLSVNLLNLENSAVDLLARNLLDGNADEATKKMMQQQMGIDLDKTRNTIQDALKAFFGMSEETLATFCK